MKRIVVCSDGTWNTADQRWNTNVVSVARSVSVKDPSGTIQIVFYDPGVGTGNLLDRLTGGAFGSGLDRNIEDAYRFVADNYDDGDELFFFGFSRGAYTVRSTVGLIRKAGLLRKVHAGRFREAYRLYRSKMLTPSSDESIEFRRAFSREAEVKFLGVWDTVGALGVPISGLRFLTHGKYDFHDVELSRIVKNAYHAVAIDERRGTFKPTLWMTKPKPDQHIEQVWFAGAHTDVGGGCPEPAGLPDVTFRWMTEKARDAGLAFDQPTVELVTEDANELGVVHKSVTGFYRLLPRHLRIIGDEKFARQSISPAVRRRYKEIPAYKPRNLVEYFRRTGEPR
jgi:uncharacterized protein (DUF2235 family)